MNISAEVSLRIRLLRRLDMLLFAVLLLVLAVIVVSSGMANIQTDAIDYYTILQRLTQNSGSPIVQNLHFVDQRSPGYPILALIPYHILSLLVDPFVQTQEIQSTGDSSAQMPTPPPPP
ncbi:MAG: hypothetical protein K8I82_24285, partial [Anaerolineae bacterium]|nr:hypothetical protein [Anaerolineae bacterium]